MALLPIPIRRRIRASGFTEPQAEVLDEVHESAVAAAREGLVRQEDAQTEYLALRGEIAEVKQDIRDFQNEMRAELALLRAQMNAAKWWLFGALAGLMVAVMGVILAAIAIWA